MDKSKVAEFSAHYQRLDEWALADIHAKGGSLTDEALFALNSVIADKGIDLENIRQTVAKQDSEYAEKELVRTKKREKRETQLLIVFFIIAALGVIFRPGQAYKTLLETLVQVAFIAVIVWGVQAIRRFLSRRKLGDQSTD